MNIKFNFEDYLFWFNKETQFKITKFKFRKEQIIAFTSELIKSYYLAKILNTTPSEININYDCYSRPFIPDLNIDFNISHSNEYLIFAISDYLKRGVDIQHYIKNFEINEIGKIVFSEFEQNLIAGNIDNFFTLWTKKEALIKAYGFGFITEDYKNTKLNLSNIEELPDFIIYSKEIFPNYYFAICLLNKTIDRLLICIEM